METSLMKGGSISIDRRIDGVEIWVKVDPTIEQFIKSASEENGRATVPLASYGRSWVGMPPTENLEIYSLNRSLEGPTFTLNGISSYLEPAKGAKTNLSFLLLKGIGEPDGVRFMIMGPVMKDTVLDFGPAVAKAVNAFLREYVVPIHIGISFAINSEKG